MTSQTLELSPLKRFWRLLQQDRKEIKNIYAYAIFNGLISLSLPLGIQAIVNLIQGGQINASWIILVIFVVLGVGLTGILQIFQLRITENLQQRIFTRAALEFTFRIPKIKMEEIYHHYAPELMNRFFDVISIQKGLSKILIDFSAASLQVIFGLLLLSFYHPFFILFSLVLIILVFAIFRFTAKKGLQASLNESKNKYQVAHWLEEVARTASTFKLSGSNLLPLERTDIEVTKYLNSREGHFKILVQQYSLMVVFKVVVATGLLAIGGILVMEQLMNIGQFIAAEIIILMVMNSVEKLILSLETIYDVLTSMEKVGQVTDLALEEEGGMNLGDHLSGPGLEIEFQNVSFHYPGQKSNVLTDITFDIKKGERIIITGENSSGKSTLLFLIAGLYDPQNGEILYNALPKNAINPVSLNSAVGDVLNQEDLFEGSIFENISIGRKNITEKDVIRVINEMCLTDFIKKLPKGIHTKIDPRGKNLAKSTAQKLLLARSIVHKPCLLIIEENMDAIDPKEEEKIKSLLFDPSQPWTLVMTTKNRNYNWGDRNIILKDGKIDQIQIVNKG